MLSLDNLSQEVSLAYGDTDNPFIVYFQGIGSASGAFQHLSRVLHSRQSIVDFLVEVEELMNDVDMGTQELVRLHPESSVAHDLAVQWAILAASPIHENFQTILSVLQERARENSVWTPVYPRTELCDLYVRAAVLYDIFLTRMMTQVKSGGHGVREMLQSLKV